MVDQQVTIGRPAVNRIEIIGTKPLEGQIIETEEEVVAFKTTYKLNPDLPVGEERVLTPGREGLVMITKTYQTYRGEKVGEPTISREVKQVVQDQVIERGTKPEELPTVTVDKLTGDNIISAEESQAVLQLTGHLTHNQPGDQVIIELGGVSHEATVTGSSFSLSLPGQDLANQTSLTVKIKRGDAVLAQVNHAYEVLPPQVIEALSIDLITSDDHINVTEAQQASLIISGQASGVSQVQVTIGDKRLTAEVIEGRYRLAVAAKDLVTNPTYKIQVSAGDQTIERPYSVADYATNQIYIIQIGSDFALDPKSETVRISGTLRLEGVAAKYYNDLYIDTVLVTLNDKTYVAGLGQAKKGTVRGAFGPEEVKDKAFSFDIPVADLMAAQGQTLMFSLPEQHHPIYNEKRGTYDDSPREVVTSIPSITNPSKYTLNHNPWLEGGTGKTVVLPPVDQVQIVGQVDGNAQVGDSVEVWLGEQVYKGQVASDKTFTVMVNRSVLQLSAGQVITAVLKGQDYAGRTISVSDLVYYPGQHQTTQSDFVATFDTSHKDNLPYFLDAIRHADYNSYGHLGKQQIGNESYHLTYHFIENSSGAINFTEEEKTRIRSVLEEISSHTRLTFSEKTVLDPKDTPDISFHQIYSHDGRSKATIGGSVYFHNGDARSYLLALHETLHSLGAADVKDVDFGHENGYITTVMTYNLNMLRPSDNQPLRLLDLMYLHYRYGVNPQQHKGDDVYTFKRNTSYQLDDSSYIWDGGGIDTFDASQETEGVTVDLTPGSWIHRGVKTDNFAIKGNEKYTTANFFDRPDLTNIKDLGKGYLTPDYETYTEFHNSQAFIGYGTQIERLIGSKHDDALRGNSVANDIFGGEGDDQIWDGAGDDYLDGGAGADRMDGGEGNDTFIVDHIDDVVIELADQGHDHVISSVDYVLPEHVEDLTLTGMAQQGRGNSNNNRITGNNQANVLTGGGGSDTFVFDSPLNGQVDVITDFDADDKLELSAAIFDKVD